MERNDGGGKCRKCRATLDWTGSPDQGEQRGGARTTHPLGPGTKESKAVAEMGTPSAVPTKGSPWEHLHVSRAGWGLLGDLGVSQLDAPGGVCVGVFRWRGRHGESGRPGPAALCLWPLAALWSPSTWPCRLPWGVKSFHLPSEATYSAVQRDWPQTSGGPRWTTGGGPAQGWAQGWARGGDPCGPRLTLI